jgi:3-dehydroquinate synthetase
MLTVPVPLNSRPDLSYDILIEPGLLANVPALIEDKFHGSSIALISDSNVADLYGGKLLARLLGKKYRLVELFEFPAGEASKCRRVKEEIEDKLFGAGMARDSRLLRCT